MTSPFIEPAFGGYFPPSSSINSVWAWLHSSSAKALDQVRLALEHRSIEKTELEKIRSDLRIPGDFDIAQISWRPDYDPFFYRQLSRRSWKIYLFRAEYIFDLEKAVVVETPELGHATYVFAKPRTMENFLALYTRISKDDIRNNRDNAAEELPGAASPGRRQAATRLRVYPRRWFASDRFSQGLVGGVYGIRTGTHVPPGLQSIQCQLLLVRSMPFRQHRIRWASVPRSWAHGHSQHAAARGTGRGGDAHQRAQDSRRLRTLQYRR